MEKGSSFEQNFNFLMLFLYICYTVCMVENLIMYCNLIWIQSRIIIIILFVQLLHAIQMQILDFIDYSWSYKNWTVKQTYVKLYIRIVSQFYLILRLESLFDIDFAQELCGVMSALDFKNFGTESVNILVRHLEGNIKESSFFTMMFICLTLFLYTYT